MYVQRHVAATAITYNTYVHMKPTVNQATYIPGITYLLFEYSTCTCSCTGVLEQPVCMNSEFYFVRCFVQLQFNLAMYAIFCAAELYLDICMYIHI